MSVVRSAYRQILKQAQKASVKYEDQSKLCFATFGLMLRMEDFAAAGYGHTPQQVVRSLFSRPCIPGIANDTPISRLEAGFDVLRRLSLVALSRKGNDCHVERREKKSGKISHLSAAGQPTNNSAGGGTTVDCGAKGGGSEAASELEAGKESIQSNGTETDADGDADGFALVKGTIFIENSLSRKVKKLSRNVIVCKNMQQMPPYSYMMPPEPLYSKNTRASFTFPLMKDAIICMAASAETQAASQVPLDSGHGLKKKLGHDFVSDCIPTRTVTVTDHIEVELWTEYVCSRIPDQKFDVDDGVTAGTVLQGSSAGTIIAGATTTGSNGRISGVGDISSKERIFRYFVVVRNYDPSRNEKRWHVQLLSRHWVFFDEDAGLVVEVVGPGVTGNFPLLAPGESHMYESGASLCGASGVMRGTFQLNAYNEEGETRCLDVHIAPTRLVAHGGGRGGVISETKTTDK